MSDVRGLVDVLGCNEVLMGVVRGAEALGLPQWYLTAGCVVQTVWNHVTGRPLTYGIKDYDLFYFDAADLSWAAEDVVIRAGAEVFGEVPVEIRNEARVHLWYEDRFGTPCPPYTSSESAIDSFAATTCCVGVRVERGEWRVYAPYGLEDVFDLVIRPNPVQAPERVYAAKTKRWLEFWPELTVLPWPGNG